jgi:hypothetical protein
MRDGNLRNSLLHLLGARDQGEDYAVLKAYEYCPQLASCLMHCSVLCSSTERSVQRRVCLCYGAQRYWEHRKEVFGGEVCIRSSGYGVRRALARVRSHDSHHGLLVTIVARIVEVHAVDRA